MTGFFVVLIVFIGVPLLLGARSRIARLEHRLRLVEEELRRRIAAGQELLREQAPATPAVIPAAPEPETQPEPDAASPPEAPSEPVVADDVPIPTAAAAYAVPATRITRSVEPEPLAEPEMAEDAGAQDAPEPVLEAETAYAETADEPRAARRASINFEELFGRKLPIWAGGITLAVAGVLIVKYAIDIGFFARVFTPAVQAVCGVLFGLGLIGGAEWAWRKRDKVQDPRVAQALSGAGISTLYAALLVSANVYGLISPLVAFIGLAVVTAGALWLSLRHGMPSALLGLAGGLAAPALTVGLDANVPMLAVYLAFTIGGLVGVSRIQRWPWLALLALAGGAGWSLWLVVAGQALTALGALSVGSFVLLLAIALPLFAFQGARATLLRGASALIGAAQLALLVAMGGYQPLHWGLFVLIAAAGQWLAWRNRDLAIIPTLSAALSGLLLLLWTQPGGTWLALIGLALTAIHAAPLLARMWREPVRLQATVELAAIAAAIPLVVLRHFHAAWGTPDPAGALAAAGGALLALSGAALGWKVAGRDKDSRFAVLLAAGGLLLILASWLGLPHWQLPLWTAVIAAALLLLAPASRDLRVAPLASAFAGLSLLALAVTLLPGRLNETAVLFGFDAPATDSPALLRWAGLAALFGLFAWRGSRSAIRLTAAATATALTYGALAQLVPEWTLPIVMAALGSGLLLMLGKREASGSERLILPFAAASVLLLALTGGHPLGEWLRLTGSGTAPADGLSALRWLAPTALGMLAAWRSRLAVLQALGQFACLSFAYGAAAQLLPGWSLPIAMAAIAAAGLLVLGRREGAGAERQLLLLGAAGVALLATTGNSVTAEWQRLWGEGLAAPDGIALARWTAMAGLFGLFAWRARPQELRASGQGMAALLAYGAAAQLIPALVLPLVPVAGVLSLAAARGRLPWPTLRIAVLTLSALSAAWALVPLVRWLIEAVLSLGGVPMLVEAPELTVVSVLRRLLVPAMLLGGALWLLRKDLAQRGLIAAGGALGGATIVALHCLYRAGFAATFGADFAGYGLGQRLLWDGVLLALSAALWKRGTLPLASRAAPVLVGIAAFHSAWYSVLLHNPLWSAQHVGALPLANLVLPLFAALPLALQLLGRMRTDWASRIDVLLQPVLMAMVALFGWASLRQAFHGTLLIDPGVPQLEDILRSILGIALAVGYLLWGIRTRRHTWRIASLVLMLAAVAKVFLFDASGLEGLLRIASFVALGFSLIGIGWLYARQLRREGQ
ncbi:MAG: DUF2339 domain-containing protein [Novosphingobium sp.]|uniref:DUF2339 domain-containing protein n=1 Tax=Novosphingobium sp. TaxID=1874826 RepID=UPI0032B82D1E